MIETDLPMNITLLVFFKNIILMYSVIKMMIEETTTEVRECCAGYTRKEEDYGCPIGKTSEPTWKSVLVSVVSQFLLFSITL